MMFDSENTKRTQVHDAQVCFVEYSVLKSIEFLNSFVISLE